jgi:small subunit ribosomal protein S25
MDAKPSSTILKDVMSIAGGDPWKTHVEDVKKAGMPNIPGEPLDDKPMKQKQSLPTLWEFLKANPQKEKKVEQARMAREERKVQNKKGDVERRETAGTEVVFVESEHQ